MVRAGTGAFRVQSEDIRLMLFHCIDPGFSTEADHDRALTVTAADPASFIRDPVQCFLRRMAVNIINTCLDHTQ